MLKSPWVAKNQKGDTIIEVMVVVAVLGLAFALAYATANGAVIKTRNAQEHAEALQYLNSQLELLRNADATLIKPVASAGPFCMETSTDIPQSIPNSVCNLGTQDVPGAGGRYHVRIDYNYASGDDRYTLQVSWEGASNLGLQHERIFYKLHTL